MKRSTIYAAFFLTVTLAACASKEKTNESTAAPRLNPEKFEAVYRGDSTALYVLKNNAGSEAYITNFGGRLVSLVTNDRDGNPTDIVLGFDNVQSYFPENNLSDMGSSVGRYANRIKDGKFTLDGVTYDLPKNNFGHCLHGGGEMGTLGWQYRVYKATQPNDSTLVLTLDSSDGDNGFPGNLRATVIYSLTSSNDLDIQYEATTDKPTIINMTNHAYFNLSGDPTKPITDHLLTIDADSFTPTDSTYMTTGEILPVSGTPMDFTSAKLIGKEIGDTVFTQIRNAHGYDHNYVLRAAGDITRRAARLEYPANGIAVEVFTTEPGIQFYSGNFLDGTQTGKDSVKYGRNAGLCLETQHYPDSPNKPEWPSTVLRPGETYRSHTIYRLSNGR